MISYKIQAGMVVLWMFAAGGSLDADESSSAYEAWEMEKGITGAGASADSDQDGIPNGIEFVTGGNPTTPDAADIAPVISVDGQYLKFTFRRTDAAAACNPHVEYSGGLAAWTVAEPGEDGIFIEEEPDFYGIGVTRVIVYLPRGLAGGVALFARLQVQVTP